MASFEPENGFIGEKQQLDINAEIAALHEASQQANQPSVQTAFAPPPFEEAVNNTIPHYQTISALNSVFLQSRTCIRNLGIRVQQLMRDNKHLSDVVDANSHEFDRLTRSINLLHHRDTELHRRDTELVQRDTVLRNYVLTLEKRLQSQSNELAHERSQNLRLARQLEQAEQNLVAQNGQLGQQSREGARATQDVKRLQQMLEAQKNELMQRWAEDARKSAVQNHQNHQLRQALAKTQNDLKCEQMEKFKYAQAASECQRILQGYSTRPDPSAAFENRPSSQSRTNWQVPDGQVADPTYQTTAVHRNASRAQGHAQGHPGDKAPSSVIKIDLTIDDDKDGPPASDVEPNKPPSQSEAGRQRQDPDAYEALREKDLPWYEGEHPLKVTKNPGAYGRVVGRAARDANHQPVSMTRRTRSRKGISAEQKMGAAVEKKQRVMDKKIARAPRSKAKKQATQKESANVRNGEIEGANDDPSVSRTPTIGSSKDYSEENDGLEDELDAALAQQSVAQPQSAKVPDNLEEDDGLEDELEAALAQESVTQRECAIMPNDLEEKNGLAEEFEAALEQTERQFSLELERAVVAEAELEVAPDAENLSLTLEQTITDGGEQISTTLNQNKRKMEADNDDWEGPSTKRYRPMFQHGEEEILWDGRIDWDLSDPENQAGTNSELEIDLDPPTWGGR